MCICVYIFLCVCMIGGYICETQYVQDGFTELAVLACVYVCERGYIYVCVYDWGLYI
jgi:hypothetical protein